MRDTARVGARKRRIPAPLVILATFALFMVFAAIATGPRDQTPGTIEFRSTTIVEALQTGDDRTLTRHLAGSAIDRDELQGRWGELLATHGEHLRTGRATVERTDDLAWVIVPVEFAEAGLAFAFGYAAPRFGPPDAPLALQEVDVRAVTDVPQSSTQAVIATVLVAVTLGAATWIWRRRSG